jgi:hypothetical protein
VWLFFLHSTTKLLDDKAYTRIKGIEKMFTDFIDSQSYKFGIHTYFSEMTDWWLKVRRGFWGWTYILLCLSWMYVSDIFYWLFVAIFVFSVIFIPFLYLKWRHPRIKKLRSWIKKSLN